MDFTTDPHNINAMHKTATIYRNGACNYIYVCIDCQCSFQTISDTLNHVESHFDDKEDFLEDDLEFSATIDGIGNVDKPKMCAPEINCFEDRNCGQTERIMDSSKNFTCKLCEQNYKTQDDLNKHLKDHINVFQCQLCCHLCSTASRLLAHLMEVHLNTTKLTCPTCSASFVDKTKFERHLQDHILAKDISYDSLIKDIFSKCEICVRLEVEEYAPSSDNLLKCDICSMAFETKNKLNLHMKRNHVPPQKDVVKRGMYECEKCNEKIQGKFLFYAHQYEHLTGGNRFDVSDQIALVDNLKKFLDDNVQYDESAPATPFGCKICCHLSVKRRKNIELHILQEHVYRMKCKTRTEKRYPCEYCGQKFTLSHNMIVHKRIHTLERPYTCHICNKSFSHSSYMKYHERVHTGIRPHQCSICGLSFKSMTKLNMHSKVHSTETTKCPICNKEFKPHRLNVHIRHVHQNEHRPYKCTVCWQAFKTSKTLKTHSYRHSGEKKFECRFQCNERFTSTAGRRGHERSKHETR